MSKPSELGRHLEFGSLNNINPRDFKKNDTVAFFDSVNLCWKRGKLKNDLNNSNISGDVLKMEIIGSNGAESVSTKYAIRKIGDFVNKEFELNGKRYKAAGVEVNKNDGEVEYTLHEVGGGSDKLYNVSSELLEAKANTEKVENKIEVVLQSLKDTVNDKYNNLLNKLYNLNKKIAKETAGLDDVKIWHGREGDLAKLLEKVKLLEAEVEKELRVIKKEIDSLGSFEDAKSKKDFALVLKNEVGSKEKLINQEHDRTKRLNEDWNRQMDKHRNWRPRNNNSRPNRPPEPTGPEPVIAPLSTDEMVYYKIYQEAEARLDDEIKRKVSQAFFPNFKLLDEVQKRRQALAEKKLGPGKDWPVSDPDFENITGKITKEVIAEWEKLDPASLEFKFEEEQTKLLEKSDELLAAINNLPARLRSDWPEEIKSVSDSIKGFSKNDKDINQLCLSSWKWLNDTEVEIEKIKAKLDFQATPATVEPESEHNYEISTSVIMELVSGRSNEVRQIMENNYAAALENVGNGNQTTEANKLFLDSLKNIFDNVRPNPAMIKKLRECGIKDWDSFKDLWGKKLAEKIAPALMKNAEEQIKRDIVNKDSGFWKKYWDKSKSVVKSGAVKPIITRMVITAACVGGVGLAFTTAGALLLPGTMIAGLVLPAVGGIVGGLARGILAKMGFSKKLDQATATGVENYRNLESGYKLQHELKNKKILKEWSVKFGTESEWMLASAISEGMADINQTQEKAEAIIGETKVEGFLNAESKKIYYNSLKRLAQDKGVEVSESDKAALRGALFELQERQTAHEAGAVSDTNPKVIKVIDGIFQSMSGRKGVMRAGLVGGLVGEAFFANSDIARGILGAAGGSVLGYKLAEGGIERQQIAKAEDKLIKQFNLFHQQLKDYVAGQGMSKDDLEDDLDRLYITLSGRGGAGVRRDEFLALRNNQNLASLAKGVIREAENIGLEIKSKSDVEKANFKEIFDALRMVKKFGEDLEKSRPVEMERLQKTKGQKIKQSIYTAVGAVGMTAFSFLVGRAAHAGIETTRGAIGDLTASFNEPAPTSAPAVEPAPLLPKESAVPPLNELTQPESTSDFSFNKIINVLTGMGIGLKSAPTGSVEDIHNFGPAPAETLMSTSADTGKTLDTYALKDPSEVKNWGVSWKNDHVLNAAHQLEKTHDDLFKHDSSKSWSRAEMQKWEMNEVKVMEKQGIDLNRLPVGTKVELFQDAQGNPHLRLVDAENLPHVRGGHGAIHEQSKTEASKTSEQEIPVLKTKPVELSDRIEFHRSLNGKDAIGYLVDSKQDFTVNGNSYHIYQYGDHKIYIGAYNGDASDTVYTYNEKGYLSGTIDKGIYHPLVGDKNSINLPPGVPTHIGVGEAAVVLSGAGEYALPDGSKVKFSYTPDGRVSGYNFTGDTYVVPETLHNYFGDKSLEALQADSDMGKLWVQGNVNSIGRNALIYESLDHNSPEAKFLYNQIHHDMQSFSNGLRKPLEELYTEDKLRDFGFDEEADKLSALREFGEGKNKAGERTAEVEAEKLAAERIKNTPFNYAEIKKSIGSLDWNSADKNMLQKYATALDFQGRILGEDGSGLRQIITEKYGVLIDESNQAKFDTWLKSKVDGWQNAQDALRDNLSYPQDKHLLDFQKDLEQNGMRNFGEIKKNTLLPNTNDSYLTYKERSRFISDLLKEFRKSVIAG
ncbi:MAG: hypothetical protein WCX97_00385 [Candidatus Magasanikbacteria bacterium]